jgi:preprotein translocase subunit SecB
MEVKEQSILNFRGVNIVNVNLSIMKAFAINEQPPIDLSIIPKIFYPDDNPNDFTIILDLKIAGKDYFNISVIAFGNFNLNKPTSDPESKGFINVNAPAIMFPYVRAFLSTLTSNLGNNFLPIILPPHFFQGDLEVYKAEVPVAPDVVAK